MCSNLFFACKIGQNWSNFHRFSPFRIFSLNKQFLTERSATERPYSFELLSEQLRHLQSWVPLVHLRCVWVCGVWVWVGCGGVWGVCALKFATLWREKRIVQLQGVDCSLVFQKICFHVLPVWVCNIAVCGYLAKNHDLFLSLFQCKETLNIQNIRGCGIQVWFSQLLSCPRQM